MYNCYLDKINTNKQQWQSEVCRKVACAHRRSKTLRYPFEDENCNTDCFSGDTRYPGAEGATDAKAFWISQAKGQRMLNKFFAFFFCVESRIVIGSFLFYHGIYEKLMLYNIHIDCACTKSNIYYDIVTWIELQGSMRK